jgi:hypothetical protein
MAKRTRTILADERHIGLPPQQRRLILACERTTHDCAMELLASCRERLPPALAGSAAIVGLFSALCRTIAETHGADVGMVKALSGMMPYEVASWTTNRNQSENQTNADSL